VYVTNISVYVGGNGQTTNCNVTVYVTNSVPNLLAVSDPHCVFSINTNVPAFASSQQFTFSPGAILVQAGFYLIIGIESTNDWWDNDNNGLTAGMGADHVNYNYLLSGNSTYYGIIGYDYGYPVLQGYGVISYTLDQYILKLTNTIGSAINLNTLIVTNGITSLCSNKLSLTSISLANGPTPEFSWTNSTGKNGDIFLGNGVVSGISVNGTVVYTNGFYSGFAVIPLQPGEWISMTVSNDDVSDLPLMNWKPF
jgi:hypothetical protein